MVVGAFPAAKLGALLLRQVSKPIANVVKSQAKSSPVFRKYVCMPPAHFYNWCEVKSKMWILNLGKPVNIPVLNEAMAIELGANLLGEGIIFFIAAGILILEYNRSSNKEAAKEEAKKQEIINFQNNIRELFIECEEQRALLRELTRRLGNIEGQNSQKPVSTKPLSPNLPITDKNVTISSIQQHPNDQGNKVIQESTKNNEGQNSQKPVSTKPLSPNLPITDKNVTISSIQQHPNDQGNKVIQESTKNNGLILKAIDDVHNQFWGYPLVEREDSVLLLSLYHIEKLLRFGQ